MLAHRNKVDGVVANDREQELLRALNEPTRARRTGRYHRCTEVQMVNSPIVHHEIVVSGVGLHRLAQMQVEIPAYLGSLLCQLEPCVDASWNDKFGRNMHGSRAGLD